MGAYEVKLAYFGCHFGCHFLKLVLKLSVNLRGDGLVLTLDFNLSLSMTNGDGDFIRIKGDWSIEQRVIWTLMW